MLILKGEMKMFYLEGVQDLKYRSTKSKDRPKKIVQTIKPNFSNLSYDKEEEKGRAEQYVISKEAKKKMEDHPNPNSTILSFSRNSLEINYYIVSENVENKINDLYDQINYLSIDLKKRL